MSDTHPFVATFEQLGEIRVREDLALNRYSEDRAKLAVSWLEALNASRTGASNSQLLANAISAKDAAWAAAKAAREQARQAPMANKIAIVALIIAMISMCVALKALFAK